MREGPTSSPGKSPGTEVRRKQQAGGGPGGNNLPLKFGQGGVGCVGRRSPRKPAPKRKRTPAEPFAPPRFSGSQSEESEANTHQIRKVNSGGGGGRAEEAGREQRQRAAASRASRGSGGDGAARGLSVWRGSGVPLPSKGRAERTSRFGSPRAGWGRGGARMLVNTGSSPTTDTPKAQRQGGCPRVGGIPLGRDKRKHSRPPVLSHDSLY
ncbi:uncharacterized protein [Petaurus breviceps papuanus]|uniref:uncharacterized protein n=1 Tax=Petaurus breviceps papuanus TaxID=3040969 RepID=UPI0036DBCE1B